MATNTSAAGLEVYESTPEEVRSQYVDPRPKANEGERLINQTLEVLILN